MQPPCNAASHMKHQTLEASRLMRHPPSLRRHSMRTDLSYGRRIFQTGHFYRALLMIYRALLTQRTVHFVMSRPLGLHTCYSPATHLQQTCNTPATHLQHICNTPATTCIMHTAHLQTTFKTPATHQQHTRNTPARQCV